MYVECLKFSLYQNIITVLPSCEVFDVPLDPPLLTK